jgi:hypothetical protein
MNTTPQFHCDVDPEDYITADVTDSNTALITIALRYQPLGDYKISALELNRDNVILLIAHLQSLVPLLDS